MLAVGRSYREYMRMLAEMTNLEVWYSHIEVQPLVDVLRAQAQTTGSKAEGVWPPTPSRSSRRR